MAYSNLPKCARLAFEGSFYLHLPLQPPNTYTFPRPTPSARPVQLIVSRHTTGLHALSSCLRYSLPLLPEQILSTFGVFPLPETFLITSNPIHSIEHLLIEHFLLLHTGIRKGERGGSLLSCSLHASGESDKGIASTSVMSVTKRRKWRVLWEHVVGVGGGISFHLRWSFPNFDNLNSTFAIFVISVYHLYYYLLLIFFL